MKQVVFCTDCKEKFECTRDNEVDVPRKLHQDGNSYKCPNGHVKNYPLTEASMVPYTMEEVGEIVQCLQEGKNNKYLISDVDLKIGDLKRCTECGYITDIVAYNGIFDYDSNSSTQCSKCMEDEKDDGRWWVSDCDDDKCEFHGDLDIPELEQEHQDYKDRDETLKTIFDKYPPKNDGVLELDRIAYMFSITKKKNDSIGNGSTVDCGGYVFNEFMDYCARNNLITK